MDQVPVQPITPIPQEPPIPPPPSPVKKFLPLFIGLFLIIIVLFGALILFGGKQNRQAAVVTPTPRPTATPFLAPTLALVSPQPTSASAVLSSSVANRLVFIKDGDIYQSDLSVISLLVKNTTPAADKLTWSPKGNFLLWRQKSNTATPSSFAVYNRAKNISFTVRPLVSGTGELVDLSFSPDEDAIATILSTDTYKLSLFTLLPTSASPSGITFTQTSPLKQVLWPTKESLLLVGSGGISSFDMASSAAKLLVDNPRVQSAKLSPDRMKIVYSAGDDKKSDLYAMNVDGSDNRQLSAIPSRVDMGSTNLPSSTLEKGFTGNAVWYLKGDKLLIGYHYLTGLPLVGIYDIVENSFTALAPFTLYNTDVIADESRLVGARAITTTTPPSWQTTFYTLSGDPKFGVVRVIPGASSPAVFQE